MSGRRALVALLAGFLFSVPLASTASAQDEDAEAAASSEREAELERLREAIGRSRERVEGFEAEERALIERLEDIDRRLSGLTAQVREAERDSERAEDASERAAVRAVAANDRLGRTRAALRRRAVALYKAGESGPVRVLFASTSLRELLSRVGTLRAVVAHDAELVQRFRAEQREEEEARVRARDARRRRDASAATLDSRRRALAAERGEKRLLMARARLDRTQERVLLVELEQAARALEETLEALGQSPQREAGRFEGPTFAEQKGQLPPPVDAPIAQAFGRVVDAEFQTQTFQKGVEFSAESGTAVHSVANGVVRFAGWFRGYGRIVILEHGDGYFSVSGHLEEIHVEVGDRLGAGDTLGSVGETGSLSGPSLYFEIRKGSDPLDPARWLATGSGS